MESASDIRKAFLDYFAANGHRVVASSPLVPHNDPTLMFVNSGMVQFKNVFTGAESRDYDRATTSQKCVRAGGKHNDLDNVGYTARHHTFFEMLGNFSFGDYFKDLAIELAWNLVTREFGLSPERLWITVYHDDDDAFTLWRKISGLPEARIVRIPTAANFWAMGETGPCGPCSEIFYDHGPELAGGPPGSADEDGDRYVEIWNLVFMQFEQLTPERRIDLPRPSVDTGMGLERVAAVLQGKHDNYDTDLLRALILASAEASGAAPDGEHAVAHRVIADHLRASSFLIADGVMPSNEGRGYVLRRIMRRAMRHAQLMGCAEPLLWRLVPALVAQMGQVFPELARAQPLIAETLKLEETRFKQTLARGLRFLDEEAAELGAGDELSGEAAFRLYDTYGFPLDLTQDALRGRGVGVDTEGFDQAMARQRAEARAAWAGSGAAATEAIWLEFRDELGASEFLGYTTEVAEGEVRAIIVEGERAQEAGDGAQASVILNQTPFYAEAGGQVGDSGVMVTAGGVEFVVEDTRKQADHLFVHSGTVRGGALKLGDAVEMRVDGARRQALRLNHSATHLLHEALRRSLGDHVTQKGSLVAPDRLRFDFSHAKAMSADELAAVEAEVNRRIRDNAEVVTHLMAPDEAVRAGALALFGEKYGEEVRVVAMGEDDGGEDDGGEDDGGEDDGGEDDGGEDDGGVDDGASFSTELCGGTHVRRTGEIGLLKVVGESASAAGVRRIEALTGAAALDFLNAREAELGRAAAALKAPPGELAARVAALLDERKRLARELAESRRALASGAGGGLESRQVGGVELALKRLDGVPAKDLRGIIDEAKKRLGSGIVALVTVADGKAALVVGVTDDLTETFDAVELVRAGAKAVGGTGGGGRRDMAQAGGPDGAKAEAALEAIEKAVGESAAAA